MPAASSQWLLLFTTVSDATSHEVLLQGHIVVWVFAWHICNSLRFFFFFFLGEIVVNEVNFVRKCIATDTSQYDLWGKLICSNFKISFITDDPMPLQVFICILCSFVKGLTLSRIYCHINKRCGKLWKIINKLLMLEICSIKMELAGR